MSKLKEYLQLLPKAAKNWDKIAEGIKNQVKNELGTLSDEDAEEITRRRLICEQCPFQSDNAIIQGIYSSQRSDIHCILCSCNIALKTASLTSNCGIEKYNLNNPAKPLPLKWEKTK